MFVPKRPDSTGVVAKMEEGRGELSPFSIMPDANLTLVWGIMPFPERRACQRMATAFGGVGYELRDTIRNFFVNNLPAAQVAKRYQAWRFQHNMVAVTIEIDDVPTVVFMADQVWCLQLFLCIQHGDCPEPPTPQPRLIGYGSPISSGYAV